MYHFRHRYLVRVVRGDTNVVTMPLIKPRRSAVAMTVHSNLARRLLLPPIPYSLLLLLVHRSLQDSPRPMAAPTPVVDNGNCFLDDRCTLLFFKQSLENQGEPALASWNEIDVMKWKGVTWVSGSNGTMTVEKLELRGWGLTGANLYPLLQRGLPLLQVLDISDNNFTGTLPATLHVCTALQVLDLSNNAFAGSLPQELNCRSSQPEILAPSPTSLSHARDMYPNLHTFNFSSNRFRGSIPGNLLVALSSVQQLDVSSNRLTGSIPSQVGGFYNLRSLTLSDNQFTGSIPFRALANISGLEELELGDNLLTGRLDIGGRGFATLKTLNASGNALEGPIPPQIGNFSRLEILSLYCNNFSGRLPAALSRCLRLRSLWLHHNYLNGSIPAELYRLSDLRTFDLANNRISGSLPSLANCSKLSIILLSQNYLSGSIPPEVGNLTNLVALSLPKNDFSSSIPPEIGLLLNLVVLDVSWNSLQGTLPHTLCHLRLLQVIFVDHNELSGELHGCMWNNYTSLRVMDGSYNGFVGSLPTAPTSAAFFGEPAPVPAFIDNPYTTTIYKYQANALAWRISTSPISLFLGHNNFSGEIPDSFGNFKSLQILQLNNNFLTGRIPPSLGKLTSIYLLDLSFNTISGTIPFELTDLNFLSQLNLSFNRLQGQIPESGQFLTFPESTFAGNVGLCGIVLGSKLCRENINSSSTRGQSLPPKLGTADVSLTALVIGFVLGFLGMVATLLLVPRARQFLFVKLPRPVRIREYDRVHGLF